jgi:hypothetical protein
MVNYLVNKQNKRLRTKIIEQLKSKDIGYRTDYRVLQG